MPTRLNVEVLDKSWMPCQQLAHRLRAFHHETAGPFPPFSIGEFGHAVDALRLVFAMTSDFIGIRVSLTPLPQRMPHPCHVFNSENFPDSFQQQSQQTSQRAQFGRDMQGPTNDSSDSAGSQDSNTDNNSPDSQQSGNAQSDAPALAKPLCCY